MAKICRHCQEQPASRPRGLCWTCYYNPSIRACYQRDKGFKPAAVEDQQPATGVDDILACICAPRCRNTIQVGKAMIEHTRALRMPWAICADCRALADAKE